MSNWEDLISYYKSYSKVSERLKVATLAQWIQESGRGSSELAKIYFNFGGIKYRERMKNFARPVDYTGSDGEETTYCAFSSVQEFVDGYWHFISSGPYPQYLSFSNDGAGYINYLARQGYSADSLYQERILALFDEAANLLGTEKVAGRTSQARLAIMVGHNRKSPGASAVEPLNMHEYEFNSTVAEKMNGESAHYNLVSKIFIRQPASTYTEEISRAYDAVADWKADACVELHFNDAGPTASGSQVLCRKGSDEAYGLAASILASVVESLGLKDRGVQQIDRSDRGGAGLYRLADIPCVLIEPFFGSDPKDCLVVAKIGQQGLGLAYLRGVRDWVTAKVA